MDEEIKDLNTDLDKEAIGETDSQTIAEGSEQDEDATMEEEMQAENAEEAHSEYRPSNRFDASAVHHLSGMYQNWFLDYASYVILERAVPHIEDGLKPVQRRILHSMKRMDDGRYNKVANIVGHTMQFHPHGDASIGDALVQMGQKDLLIDTQGNWGNILTGSSAAAPRYIEARLSKFALETVFNPKTTEWQFSYDGRNKEPITLPVKFPLLLVQGVEGIAVGLNSKILPHNFVEICDAAIAYLRGKEFHLYPDFPTGGSIDVSKYNDGQRGGNVKVRAKIEKLDNKTLVIRDIPFSRTSESLIDSITRAVEKGKIKVRKVEDLTAANVEILVHLTPGVSSDKTLDALYKFTDCEVSISPNCCVIRDRKPQFLTISDILRSSTDQTLNLLKRELEIRRDELLEQLFFISLEKIFIEERIYKDKKFENATSIDSICEHIDARLTPFYHLFVREVRKEDILRLLEIKMQRIAKFSKDKADELMARIQAEIDEIEKDLNRMVDVTCEWYEHLRNKYGAEHPRLTEIRNFENIEATAVVEANQKLYINRQEGFIGTGLKKDEFVSNCSDIDDVIVFYRDGKFKVVRVAEKIFVGKNILHLQVWKRGDIRTTYNMVYRDGKAGFYYVKRFNIPSITRDKEYDLTNGTPSSRVVYFSANPNGEAEVIKITYEPNVKLKKIFFDYDFTNLAVKGRGSRGNIISKYPLHRISLKSHGRSTLGGQKVWYDPDVNRLNHDGQGNLLGDFSDGDQILVILQDGDFYVTTPNVDNHFETNVKRIEKFHPNKVYTCVLYDKDNKNLPYIKRFRLDKATKNHHNYLVNPQSKEIIFTDVAFPRVLVTFGGVDAFRPQMEIDAEQYVPVKGYDARGKRVSTYKIERIEELEPLRFPEGQADDEVESTEGEPAELENLDPDAGKSEQQVRDELTGQTSLSFDEY